MDEVSPKYIIRIHGSIVTDNTRLRVFVRPVRYRRSSYIMVCDSTGTREATEFVSGQVRAPTVETFPYSDSRLKLQVLQTMQGSGMDEGTDQPLFVKILCRKGHLRAKAFLLGGQIWGGAEQMFRIYGHILGRVVVERQGARSTREVVSKQYDRR